MTDTCLYCGKIVNKDILYCTAVCKDKLFYEELEEHEPEILDINEDWLKDD